METTSPWNDHKRFQASEIHRQNPQKKNAKEIPQR